MKDNAEAPSRRLGTRRWSAAGDLLEVTDANGHTTRFTYDAQGSLMTTIDALGGRTVVQYNEQNLPLRTIDAMGLRMRVSSMRKVVWWRKVMP